MTWNGIQLKQIESFMFCFAKCTEIDKNGELERWKRTYSQKNNRTFGLTYVRKLLICPELSMEWATENYCI